MATSSANPLVRQFPCPGCGATLEFNPQAGQLQCPYCGREELIPESAEQVVERSYEEYLNTNHTQIAALSTTALEIDCPGCAAQITFEPPDVAGQCPFCTTSLVTQPHAPNPVLAPEAILPFVVGRKQARELIQKWISTRWFAPNGLKKMAQQEGTQGVYLPYWTYDCHTTSHYQGQKGIYYYVTETYTETNSEGKTETKTRQVRRTRWHSVSGRVQRFFDDVLIPAVQSVSTQRLDCLEPWNLSKLVPYDSSYLSGFKAQRYQTNLKSGFEAAKGKMEPTIHSDVCHDIGGDEQRVNSVSTSYSAITFKHILLPVWLASYRFQNKQYQVVINAETGKVVGDRPYSILKITLAVLAVAGIIAAIFGIKTYLDQPQISPQRPTPPPTEVSPGRSVSPSTPPIAQPDDAYRQAINTATRASSQVQSAQTRNDWLAIAADWIEAIAFLRAVPPSSPNYDTAQTKITEYQRNLDYAEQQVRNLSQ